MSRSCKKRGVLKDGSSWSKKHANRVFRSRNKHSLRIVFINGDYDELMLFKMNELVNQWDICDWKSFWGGDHLELEECIDDHLRYPRLYPGDPKTTFEERKRMYFNK